ncbi:CMGC/DYRK protein kinase [Mucor circinelloides 1006PhL]|uniref:CMGC/DYRK protein kinase n=1 Tax=Mucor circinelloides f. circinelloides (strain 1006PhL) TaxID=1220926 RepID=S2JVQ2_MUCC1|nr:CMGC/DYRK protein kinase [Mucor circinelloides 1006PhL]
MHARSRPPSSYNIFKRATVQYHQVIESINPAFKTDLIYIPRRTLTNPREPSKNSGYDNIHDDYILRVKDILGDIEKYEILDLMGQGTFGQVVMCKTLRTGELVAVKVIKNHFSYHAQGEKEVAILRQLKSRPDDKDRFLQLRHSFLFRGHLCAVFELLSISLHKVLSQRPGRPNLAIKDIQKISFNILETLALLKDMRIIHTDLKPDNILLKRFDDIHNVKLIDYGSAMMENGELNYCIQTAFYRSPEVILQAGITCAIDMWSFGCFVAELYTGRPLFPSGNEATLLHMMTTSLQCLPPDDMLLMGNKSSNFFDVKNAQNGQTRLKKLVNAPHDMPVSNTTLKDRIMGLISNDEEGDDDDSLIDNFQERTDKENLYDFLKNILVFDPRIRFTPIRALQHPFITSAMGNITVRPLLHHSTSTEPQVQRPAMPQISKSTGSITSDMIYASLAKAVASSSSLNTSRTTEDSIDVLTPNSSQIHLQQQKQGSLSPHVIIAPDSAIKSVASPPLKSILKHKKIPSKSNTPITLIPSLSSPIRGQQENTLDRKVAFLHQSRPNSTSQISDQSITQPTAAADDPIPDVVNLNANASMYNQNYMTQPQTYMTQYEQQQWMAYLAQHNTTNATATQSIVAPVAYALSPSYATNANLPYIYQQAQALQQQIMNPTYTTYPYQQPYLLPQQKQQQQLHQSPLLMYSINNHHQNS